MQVEEADTDTGTCCGCEHVLARAAQGVCEATGTCLSPPSSS